MTDKLKKDTAREKFRSSVSINDISDTERLDGYDYKWVDTQFLEGLKRVDRYIDANWEVVYSKDKPKDDRKNAADQAVKATVPKPVTRTTRGGHTQVYMKIKKEDRAKNQTAKAARDEARLQASRRPMIDKKGNKITIREEVNMNKLGDGNVPSGPQEV